MGISYSSLQIFGSDVYENDKSYTLIDPWDFECKIKEVYGIVLSEGLYEALIEEGTKEEDIHFEEYASKYNHDTFGDYKALMLFDYGNFVSGNRDVAVGFLVDLNKENFEQLEEKKNIFLQELEDFKVKTGLRISTPKFDSLTYVL